MQNFMSTGRAEERCVQVGITYRPLSAMWPWKCGRVILCVTSAFERQWETILLLFKAYQNIDARTDPVRVSARLADCFGLTVGNASKFHFLTVAVKKHSDTQGGELFSHGPCPRIVGVP